MHAVRVFFLVSVWDWNGEGLGETVWVEDVERMYVCTCWGVGGLCEV